MSNRVFASMLLVAVVAACGGDGRITEPKSPTKLTGLAAIGTDATTGAVIETDFDDYAPGGSVNLTGRGWAPNESVHLVMSEDPDVHADVVQDVETDSAGVFSLRFYQVQESDLGVRFTLTGTGSTSGSKVIVQFTDGRNISAITIAPASPGAGASATATVQVVLNTGSGATTWQGTKWEIRNSANAIVAASSPACLDTPNHSDTDADKFSGNKHQESFSFTAGAAGTYEFRVYVFGTDNCASASEATIQSLSFTVAGSNSAPVLAGIGNKSVDEGSALTFTASATDGDTPAQTLTYSLVGGPAGASIDASSGAFSWTPTDGPAQTATFTVKVTDNGSPAMSDEESITVTVNNVKPTATFNAPASVSAGANINLSLTAPTDPSSVDVTAGLTYAFDCGDGNGYSALSATSTAACSTSSPGSRTVKGKIHDKDGGETEYTASVAIDNVPPTASAGGPYTGNEGSSITITGSGSDPDGGTVGYLWTVAPNDGRCAIASPTSASTSVACNDNGAWTLTLTVTDDETSSTTSDAALTVSNVAPTITGLTAPSAVNEGQNIVFSVTSVSDPSTADVAAGFTYAFSCDGTTPASFSSTNSKTCATTDNGSVTIKAVVKDKDGATSAVASQSVTVNNVNPTATFNAPSPVNEGSNINLSLTAPFDPSSADVAAGFTYAFDCGSGYGAFGATSTATCSTNDNGSRTVKAKIKDKDGGFTEYSASVTINNVPPSITLLTVPVVPIAAGSNNVTVTWTFDDPGTADTWTCEISWDTGLPYEAGSLTGNTCSATTTLGAGIYTVTARVTDDDGGSDTETATTYIVVYDPSAGFVTGGGWINSPAGAYVLAPTLTGKATFGFVSRYKKGMTTPDGSTEFQFHAASMNFKSTVYEWLVVSGARGQFKGIGTINGAGNYGFLLTAIDGQVSGGGGTDKFRIKIWDIATSAIVYDNNMGASDTADPVTVLGGGSINIQSK